MLVSEEACDEASNTEASQFPRVLDLPGAGSGQQTGSAMPAERTWTWTVLGAGSILPRAGYGSAGHALRFTRPEDQPETTPVTLFDCGPGTVRALGNAGIGIADVHRVVISHFHPDHWLDLLAFAFARRNPALADAPPIEIIGPRGLAELLDRAAAILGTRSWLRFDRASVVEIDPSACPVPLERDGFRLSWTATRHTPESVAWRADLEGGTSVVYTGDSGENLDVAELAREVSLFVCECSFPDEERVEHHLTPSSAGRLAARAACRRLLLTHFYPSLDPEDAREGAARHFHGPIEISRDGSSHSIGQSAGPPAPPPPRSGDRTSLPI
jgi:ribonuclease BN (tRNA processing enzyme)